MATDHRTIKALLIGAVLALFVLLTGAAMVWGLQNEQDDISKRVNDALVDAGLSVQEIDVKGRDVYLAGAANELQRSEAEAVVRELQGVRTVEWNDLPDVVIIRDTTPPTTSAPPGGGTPPTTRGDS